MFLPGLLKAFDDRLGEVQATGEVGKTGDGGLHGIDDFACVLGGEINIVGKPEKIRRGRMLSFAGHGKRMPAVRPFAAGEVE